MPTRADLNPEEQRRADARRAKMTRAEQEQLDRHFDFGPLASGFNSLFNPFASNFGSWWPGGGSKKPKAEETNNRPPGRGIPRPRLLTPDELQKDAFDFGPLPSWNDNVYAQARAKINETLETNLGVINAKKAEASRAISQLPGIFEGQFERSNERLEGFGDQAVNVINEQGPLFIPIDEGGISPEVQAGVARPFLASNENLNDIAQAQVPLIHSGNEQFALGLTGLARSEAAAEEALLARERASAYNAWQLQRGQLEVQRAQALEDQGQSDAELYNFYTAIPFGMQQVGAKRGELIARYDPESAEAIRGFSSYSAINRRYEELKKKYPNEKTTILAMLIDEWGDTQPRALSMWFYDQGETSPHDKELG